MPIKTAHAGVRRLAKPAIEQVAAKQVGHEMLHVTAKELSEHHLHHQQRQKRHQDTPPHAENRPLVLFLEIALDQFLEQEPILADFGPKRMNQRHLYLAPRRNTTAPTVRKSIHKSSQGDQFKT